MTPRTLAHEQAPEDLAMEPGIYLDLPAKAYHADPCPEPSLNSSIAEILQTDTPYHAWSCHPRLNPAFDPMSDKEATTKRKTAMGSACHELYLGRGPGLHVIKALGKDGQPATNYRLDKTKAERDQAMIAGKVPLLQCDFDEAQRIVDQVRKQLEWLERDLGPDPDPEAVILTHGNGIWRRCMADLLSKSRRRIADLKFTNTTASRDEWARQVERMGYHIRAGHYRSCLAEVERVSASKIDYLFIIVELGPPVLVAVRELDYAYSEIGLDLAEKAAAKWEYHMRTGHWPAYPQSIETIDAPLWFVNRYAELMGVRP